MRNLSFDKRKIIEYLLLMLFCLSLNFFSRQNHNLFYIVTEVVIAVLGFTMMIVALSTVKICKNNYFHYLAIIFGIVSIVNFVYLLTYKGIDVFSRNHNRWYQLNILAEYYECIMLNLAVIYINKKFNWYKTLLNNTIAIMLIILGIVIFKVFPARFFKGHGLIAFHHVGVILFLLCFFIILIRLMKSKAEILNENKPGLLTAIFLKILSCFFLTLYNNDYIMLLVAGHFFKFISYYFIFRVIFKDIVINPYSILSWNLKKKTNELEIVNRELDKANYKVENIEKLHEKFINLIPDGIIIVRDKKIASVNERFLKMFGIEDEKELINKDYIDILEGPYHKIFENRTANMDGNILEKPQEYEFVWNGNKKWVEIMSLISNDEYGEYVISAVRNIEDRKQAERAVQLLEIKKKEENMKNEFFANISHELRTPINVIYSALQVENTYLQSDNGKEHIVKYNKIIKQNCLRLMKLVNNIIDVSRIEASFFKPHLRTENIVSIVEDITMSIAEYVKSKNIDIIFDTEIEEAYVNCDSDLIERIILNLLSNAVKYGKEGGHIDVYISQSSPSNISILVKDDGIGIPDEMKNRIFNRFLKVDNSLSRKTEGSGIGLSLTKQLVEIHKGSITFESKLNVGTEFVITLPTVEEYCVNDASKAEEISNYSKNAIKSSEIEFSDI